MSEREVPKQYQALYARTQTKKAGPLSAIKMQCLECVGFVRDEVIACTDSGCPLFQYRPFGPRVAKPRTEVQRAADRAAGVRLRRLKDSPAPSDLLGQ